MVTASISWSPVALAGSLPSSAHRVGDLLAPAVADREVDVKATVAVGRLDGVAQPTRRLLADELEVADCARAPSAGAQISSTTSVMISMSGASSPGSRCRF
jgi:hypothetical protein